MGDLGRKTLHNEIINLERKLEVLKREQFKQCDNFELQCVEARLIVKTKVGNFISSPYMSIILLILWGISLHYMGLA